MPVKLHSDFLGDLTQVGDAALAGRALRKCFDPAGRFIEQAKEDHRYEGIQGGWIRKISKGMRIIYVRNGDEITLYRAGQHSVEDNLRAPPAVEGVTIASDPILDAMRGGVGESRRTFARGTEELEASDAEAGSKGAPQGSRLLYNHVERFLYGNLLGRRFLPHKDVYLVSPYMSPSLVRSTHPFGQMLDELIEGGATVWLVTTPPLNESDLAPYNDLEARGINVYFNEFLHAKVYAFTLNRELLKPDQQRHSDFVALGSANMTFSGINPLGLQRRNIQYEISYQSYPDDWVEIERFVLHVTELGAELREIRANLLSQSR